MFSSSRTGTTGPYSWCIQLWNAARSVVNRGSDKRTGSLFMSLAPHPGGGKWMSRVCTGACRARHAPVVGSRTQKDRQFLDAVDEDGGVVLQRSEERRVGRECM